jgi:hypothetical protein
MFLVLLGQMVSSHRMRMGIVVVVLNTTSHLSLLELTRADGTYEG